ncbi:MAG: hypothetical protein FJ145_13360 [Deltaproteobacteria bacterium]|nr:hypothetical protein [Deltaproteobacteria bacterium]
MALDLRSVVARDIADMERSISQKTAEVNQLRQQLQDYKSALSFLSKGRGSVRVSGRQRGPRSTLRSGLDDLPEVFNSSDFVEAASGSGKDPRYLRQTLVRWAAQGKIKRMERGKYRKASSRAQSNGHVRVAAPAGQRGPRSSLRNVLEVLPGTFTSADFVKAAAGSRKDPHYLRQTLVRWAAQKKLKRLDRGKYRKMK